MSLIVVRLRIVWIYIYTYGILAMIAKSLNYKGNQLILLIVESNQVVEGWPVTNTIENLKSVRGT